MSEKHFILATAGHVDHGKSALVKALTGIDPDRLPEEKARGVTIELGFAQLQLPSPNEPGQSYSIGVVDVPGHGDFVRNMVAGVGAIDLALLVVAVDDGWMPQTEEHLQILAYLGVPQIVVALTKIDLGGSVDAAENDVRAQLRNSPFPTASIVKTSVTNGAGLDDLRTHLTWEFSLLRPQRDVDKPRLFVDRAFTLRGIGTIVTGTLSGGKFRSGEAVVVQPANLPARIRSLQNHNREVSEIGPGTRAASNIPDLSIARHQTDRGVRRGDVVTRMDLGNPTAILDVILMRSPRLASGSRPVRHGAHVRVHHGSGNFAARVFLQGGKPLVAGNSAVAELRLDSPIFTFVGDRFVMRDGSEKQTLAGGIVLDTEASAKKFRTPTQREFLEKRAHAPLDVRVFVETQLARDHFASSSDLLKKSCFDAVEISAALDSLAARNGIIRRGDFVADAGWWETARATAFTAIDAQHQASPDLVGIDLARLRNLFVHDSPEMFEMLVADLCQNGATQVGDSIKRTTHRPTLPPQLQVAGAAIRRLLADKPFDPPSRKELAPDMPSQQALRFLINTGEVVAIADDVLTTSDAFRKMRDAVIEFIRHHGPAAVSELRRSLGSSRRVMVPFLERLDRDGVTRRVGDRRALPG